MGIKADKNNSKYIKEFVLQSKEVIEEQILYFLNAVGLKALEIARTNGDYTDRTGNLRSSVGYIVFKGTKPIEQGGFDANENEATGDSKDGITGATDGKDLAIELGKELDNPYSLIVVAGMFYAEYLEWGAYSTIKSKRTVNKKTYDVLTSARIEAEIYAQQLFNKLNERVQGI